MNRTVAIRIRRLPVSLRIGLRGTIVGIAILASLVAVGLVSLSLGESRLALTEIVAGLSADAGDPLRFAVREVRLPRVVAGLVIGFSLAASGAVFQSLTRNGLVSPDIIGVNSGASFAAVTAVVVGTNAVGQGDAFEVSYAMTVVVALAGALAAAAAVYILGYRRGLSPYRLVLVGIGVTTVLQAGTAYMLTLTRFPFATDLAFRWMIGRIYGADWTEVAPAIAAFVVLIALLFLFSRWFAALTLGDGVATGLGAKVEAQRLGLLVVAVGLAAFAVALAGPVGFVAFIAPHIARGLVKRPTGSLPVLAGLVGAVLVVGADLVARRVVAPAELPAGAITALIGAPYFLFLLYRANRLGVGA